MKPQEIKDLLYKIVDEIDHQYRRDCRNNTRGKEYLDKHIDILLQDSSDTRKVPVIKLIDTGELLQVSECFIFTCGTLLHNELDRYGFPDEQVIYTSAELEWSEEDLDIFSHQSYKEYLEEQKIQEKIDSLMEGVSTKEYTTRRRELEIEFGLKPLQ